MGLSGSRSGYGRFDVAAFTDARAIVFMQPASSYPLVP